MGEGEAEQSAGWQFAETPGQAFEFGRGAGDWRPDCFPLQSGTNGMK